MTGVASSRIILHRGFIFNRLLCEDNFTLLHVLMVQGISSVVTANHCGLLEIAQNGLLGATTLGGPLG